MIELRHLRYAVAVADEGHVTRAAERLGIQQPPLSQQIKALEAMVGAPLFRRLPRGVELTDVGRVFIERARRVLGDVDVAVEEARRVARGEEGRLVIGFTASAAFHPLVGSAVRKLRETSPGVVLSLEEGGSVLLVEALRAGRLDAAFVRPPFDGTDRLRLTPLLVEEMLVAVPERHPLASRAGRGRRVALQALSGETFVLYRRPFVSGLYDTIVAACRAAGFSPKIGQEAPRLVTTLSLVSAGLGVSIIPASMARLETNGVVYLGIERAAGLAAPLDFACRDEEPSGCLRRFSEIVADHAAAYGGGG
ncbi:LysR family transcriptional regulator [Methylopila sp. M107]|uniref:LysR family transcriptional regulator n=1 Tax=Methylopila sp. M107 TaxID=1101190 RepID=UPI00036992A2|nr:LysR family transcriptional regulator [Methylopila sp. M107]